MLYYIIVTDTEDSFNIDCVMSPSANEAVLHIKEREAAAGIALTDDEIVAVLECKEKPKLAACRSDGEVISYEAEGEVN